MKLARVIGQVVATSKDAALEGVTLLLLQPVDETLADVGESFVASDAGVRRGVGEIVYVVQGGDACHTGPDGRLMPTDAAVMGIANRLHARG